MNSLQNAAVGGCLLLITAYYVMHEFGERTFVIALVGFLVFALFTFATTRKITYAIFGMVFGDLVSGIGHGIGSIGDGVSDWTSYRRERLAHRPSGVPDWHELQQEASPQENPDGDNDGPDSPQGASTDDLDVPDFMKDENSNQQNVGLRILEPR